MPPRYVAKLAKPEERFDYCVKLGQWAEAVEIAAKLRDVERLQQVAAACPSPPIKASVTAALAQISPT
jgi:hypothetical protein